MSVGLLIVTHGEVGTALLDSARGMLDGLPLETESISVSNRCDPEDVGGEVGAAIERLNAGDGVLVLTDIYGATPSNIAMRFQDDARRVVVASGINLPMLVRVLNYPGMTVEQLLEKALSGGRDGVFRCRKEET